MEKWGDWPGPYGWPASGPGWSPGFPGAPTLSQAMPAVPIQGQGAKHFRLWGPAGGPSWSDSALPV